MADRRKLLLVVGPGRSGTSAFSGSAAALGYWVPQPEVQADRSNPRGFNESWWAVRFHDRILESLKMVNYDARPYAWQLTQRAARRQEIHDELREWLAGEFDNHDRVLVKDPRTAWFLGLWKQISDDLDLDLRFVTVLRPPAEVVASASKAYPTHHRDTSRLAGWVNVLLRSEKMTRDDQRGFVRYADLLADSRKVLEQIDKTADLDFDWADKAALTNVESFLDPGLRRQNASLDAVDAPSYLIDIATRVWDAFNSLVSKDGKTAQRDLDALRGEYRRTYLEAEQLVRHSIDHRKDEIKALRRRRARAAEDTAAESAAT